MVKCPITGVKKKERKQYYMFSIREIHNELIKPANEGGFAGAYNDEGKLLISDTTLRSILPKNISRITESQKQMCGCEICLNAYSLMLAFNSWRTRKKNFWANQVNTAATARLANSFQVALNRFKEGAFPDGRVLWPKATDAMYSMTCPRVVNHDLVKLQCALLRCKNCPPLNKEGVQRGL
jgi:hypothetical protein